MFKTCQIRVRGTNKLQEPYCPGLAAIAKFRVLRWAGLYCVSDMFTSNKLSWLEVISNYHLWTYVCYYNCEQTLLCTKFNCETFKRTSKGLNKILPLTRTSICYKEERKRPSGGWGGGGAPEGALCWARSLANGSKRPEAKFTAPANYHFTFILNLFRLTLEISIFH